MRIPILTLAEYAGVDASGKLFVAGTVDGVSLQRNAGAPVGAIGPVPIPPLYLVAVIEGSIVDGITHSVALRIVNDDRKDVAPENVVGQFSFQINKHGRPMRAQIIAQLQGLKVPGPGDYELVVIVDGKELATTPFYVTDETPDAVK